MSVNCVKLFLIVIISACVVLSKAGEFEEVPHIARHTGHQKHHGFDDKIPGHRNFLATDYLLDGERERRLHFGGITAKETSTDGESGLSLRQVTDGKHFIQMIYSGDAGLIDCEYIRQKKIVQNFLDSFQRDIERARYNDKTNNTQTDVIERITSKDRFDDYLENEIIPAENMDFNMNFQREGMKNITFQYLNSVSDIPTDIKQWLNYPALRDECKRKHQELKRILRHREHGTEEQKKAAEEHLERSRRSVSDIFIMPGTKWCGRGQSAGTYVELGGLDTVDHCCRRHDHCPAVVKGLQTKYNYFNPSIFTTSHCKCDLRHKRDLSNLLRVPGTKWCGKGRSATKYTHLGGFSNADKCCRMHDLGCPHWIMGFEEKYGLFNWRVNTLMHCRCDERFRTCLKLVDSTAANMVGKLFFNVVQTKCFVFKREKTCVSPSWWGKCTKYTHKKRAILRNNMLY